jgi:DNA polymerase III subunit alpha
VDSAIECGQRAWRDRAAGQGGLFGEDFGPQPEFERPLPRAPDWSGRVKLQGEKEMLGFYVTGHPLDQFRDRISDLATHDSGCLEGLAKNTEVALCGVIAQVQRKRNKEGKPWAAMQLDDLSGSVDGLVFASQFERLAQELVEDEAVLVRGLVLPEENGPPKISVQDVTRLENARVNLPSLISIRVLLGRGAGDRAASLEQLFRGKTGETRVRLRLEKPRDFSIILDVPARVKPDKEFRNAVEQICGSEAIEVLAG